MRSFAVALILSASLVALVSLGQLDATPLWTAPLTVLIGVMAASAATGGITWLAVVSGALGMLAFGWLSAWNPQLALMVVCASWLAPRAWLTRTQRDLVVLAATALPAAIVAGLIVAHFALAPLAQHLAACIFAGAALATSNVVVRVHSPMAHGLLTAGRALEGDVGDALQEAAEAYSVPAGTDERKSRARWKALLRDADARVALRDVAGQDAENKRADLDARILESARSLRAAAGHVSHSAPELSPPEQVTPVVPSGESTSEPEQRPEPEAGDPLPSANALVP